MRHDNYYKGQSHLPPSERENVNYDHPDSFESDLLCRHLEGLKEGRTIQMPVYDFTTHTRSDQVVDVHPAPVIIIEGILIFSESDLCDKMDIKVFVDTDADVRILRRITRDVNERGRSIYVSTMRWQFL